MELLEPNLNNDHTTVHRIHQNESIFADCIGEIMIGVVVVMMVGDSFIGAGSSQNVCLERMGEKVEK